MRLTGEGGWLSIFHAKAAAFGIWLARVWVWLFFAKELSAFRHSGLEA